LQYNALAAVLVFILFCYFNQWHNLFFSLILVYPSGFDKLSLTLLINKAAPVRVARPCQELCDQNIY